MKKWEYKLFEFGKKGIFEKWEKTEERLNELGRNGWELVGVTGYQDRAVFKRELK